MKGASTSGGRLNGAGGLPLLPDEVDVLDDFCFPVLFEGAIANAGRFKPSGRDSQWNRGLRVVQVFFKQSEFQGTCGIIGHSKTQTVTAL